MTTMSHHNIEGASLEVFHWTHDPSDPHPVANNETGWYWWFCQPGCLPDCEPQGPYATEQEALAEATEGLVEFNS
jgi:hypothetical protein